MGCRGACVAAIAWIATLLAALPAAAATFPVNSTADANDAVIGDGTCATMTGACTLRGAVQEANANPDADTIVLPAGRFHLGGGGLGLLGEIAIREDVTISGAGARSTVLDRGDSTFGARLLSVSGSGTGVVISGLTLDGGSTSGDGGAILNGGTLTLDAVTLRNSLATRGGGIATSGPLTVNASSIVANSARSSGGGIAVLGAGTLAAVNSTLSANKVLNSGFGAAGSGAGIASSGGDTTLSHVTVADNTTAERNAGAVAGPMNLVDTVLANAGTTGNCAQTAAGAPVSKGHNLADDGSCALTADGDAPSTDARLGALRSSDGPTDVHVPISGSPVVDTAAAATCPATDQRGLSRPQGAGCDKGAVEYQPVADLNLQMSDSPDPIPADDQLTYTLTLSNLGPDAGYGIVVRHELPAGAVLLSLAPNCSALGGVVTCAVERLLAGVTTATAVIVRPETVGAITSLANVTAASVDPVLSSNFATAATTVLSRMFAKRPGTVAAPPSPPVQGQSIAAALVRGVLKIRLPGQLKFTRLTEARTLPVGTTVDASRGTVRLTSATDASGGTQAADFYGGSFKVDQRPGQVLTRLRLTGGSFAGCKRTAAPAAGAAAAHAAGAVIARAATLVRESNAKAKSKTAAKKTDSKKSSGKQPERHVWGDGKGKFRTEGRYGSASVRGTKWLTQDRCDGTRVYVQHGKVAVRDFARKRTKLVRTGKSLLVRAPKRR